MQSAEVGSRATPAGPAARGKVGSTAIVAHNKRHDQALLLANTASCQLRLYDASRFRLQETFFLITAALVNTAQHVHSAVTQPAHNDRAVVQRQQRCFSAWVDVIQCTCSNMIAQLHKAINVKFQSQC